MSRRILLRERIEGGGRDRVAREVLVTLVVGVLAASSARLMRDLPTWGGLAVEGFKVSMSYQLTHRHRRTQTFARNTAKEM